MTQCDVKLARRAFLGLKANYEVGTPPSDERRQRHERRGVRVMPSLGTHQGAHGTLTAAVKGVH